MTFPKKHTCKINIDGVEYLWHLNRNWESKSCWIVIARKGYENCQLLFLDPYHHDILPTKGTVKFAVRSALTNGWKPLIKGVPVRVAYNGRLFEKLPEDIQNWEHRKDKKYL